VNGDRPADAIGQAAAPAQRRLSLRRHLLVVLLVPLMLLLLVNSLITYGGALIYANHVHDRGLADDTLSLTQMLIREAPDGHISPQATFLLEYEPQGHNYFSVSSTKHGQLAGTEIVQPPVGLLAPDREPELFDVRVKHRQLRAAAMLIPNTLDPDDMLTITLAESLHDRRAQAKEILLLSIPAQTLLILVVFALVWFGVGSGLRMLNPLTARLAAREHDLTPIGNDDVPKEILPLTRTIDGLFARLRHMLLLQERFIADAAHQLRTPLAGLRVHVERAQKDPAPATVADALQHIQRLTLRASRTSSQLLALTRVQSSEPESQHSEPLDLNALVPQLVSQRVHEALAARVDLGYEGTTAPGWIEGDPTILQELLDNLIDNALRYAGPGSIVTVAVDTVDRQVRLSVEDNGPGVPEPLLGRLGERFFRVPGCREEGSGLGLAIVQRMAERHQAVVRYANREGGGFRVEVGFPLVAH